MAVIGKRLRKALPLFFFLFTLFGTLRGVFPSPVGASPSFSPNFSYDIQSHRLSVHIDPLQHTIKGKDQLEIQPRGKRAQISLLLNSRLKVNEIVSVRTGQPLQWVETSFSDTVKRVDVSVPNRTNSLSISFEGLIYDPVSEGKRPQSVTGDQTSGLIGPEGGLSIVVFPLVPGQTRYHHPIRNRDHHPRTLSCRHPGGACIRRTESRAFGDHLVLQTAR